MPDEESFKKFQDPHPDVNDLLIYWYLTCVVKFSENTISSF